MKVFSFLYNSFVWESGWSTISVHLSIDGANKAMGKHKDQIFNEWSKMYGPSGSFPNTMSWDDYIADRNWQVEEIEVLP